MLDKQYDVNLAIANQNKLCKEKDYPHFAPNSGRCWKCGRNIYNKHGWKVEYGRQIEVPLDSEELRYTTGVTVEEAGKNLVIGCPHCNRSYCD